VAAAADLTGSGRMDIVTIDERRGTFKSSPGHQ